MRISCKPKLADHGTKKICSLGFNSMSALVSIVIPTFNRSHTIKRAIESVVSQTYSDWELIVVDNSSTDDTLEVLSEFSGINISVLTVDNKGVIGHSRNVGINNSKGRYIAFLDSDDWWDKEKLSISISLLENNNIDLVYHDCLVMSSGRPKRTHCRKLSENSLKDLIVNGNTLITSSVVVSRFSIINAGCFNESRDTIGWEDYHLWLKLAKSSRVFYKISKSCGFYFQGDDNFDTPNQVLLNLVKIDSHLKKEYKSITSRYKIWWIYYAKGRASIKCNNFKNARKALLKVMVSNAPALFKIKSIYLQLSILFRT
jgi:glycosyltransferase involved in cell wall biosynthesis